MGGMALSSSIESSAVGGTPWSRRLAALLLPKTPNARLSSILFFDLQSAHRDPPRHGLLGLFEGQGQHAVFELRADLLLIDLVRQRERPGEMAEIGRASCRERV